MRKPLVLHERDAHEDLIEILSKYRDQMPPAVIHSFTGTVEQAQTYLSMGIYLGMTGMNQYSLILFPLHNKKKLRFLFQTK